MFKRVLLFFLFCVSTAGCELVFSMQEGDVRKVVDRRLSQKIVYDGEPASYFTEYCSYVIEKIYKNSEGVKLINKISALLEEASTIDEVRFVDISGGGGGTAFVHNAEFNKDREITAIPSNILCININLDNAIRVVSPKAHWCDQLFGISECIYDCENIDNIGPVYRISKAFSPFYVTIVHELIHLKHFLETFLRKGDDSYISYGKAIAIGTYKQIIAESKLHELPELTERSFYVKRSIPWDNFEERRTVVGPDIDGISELSFRIVEGLPIRYIYQGPDNCFYEDPLVLHQIVKDALPDNISLEESVDKIVAKFMIKGYCSEEGLDFTRSLKYSPLAIQLALFADSQIIRAHEMNKAAEKRKALKFLSSQREESTASMQSTSCRLSDLNTIECCDEFEIDFWIKSNPNKSKESYEISMARDFRNFLRSVDKSRLADFTNAVATSFNTVWRQHNAGEAMFFTNFEDLYRILDEEKRNS